jgi:hypothetical protein
VYGVAVTEAMALGTAREAALLPCGERYIQRVHRSAYGYSPSFPLLFFSFPLFFVL